MILAFIDSINKLNDGDSDRVVGFLKPKYIGEQEIKKGHYNIRLRLNENNNDLYKSFVTEEPLSKPLRKYTPSEKLMKNCIDWFKERISELKKNSSEDLGSVVQNIADSFYFTTIHVANDENAYIVFETLNARGVKLSSSDLLKNYLFQKISPNGEAALSDIENKWRKIVSTIGSEDLVDFIRYYWNSRNKITRKVDLYREITKQNPTAASVEKLLDGLLNSSTIYAALNNPNDELWEGEEEISENLGALKIFKLKQPFVPLLIGKELLTDQQFKKLLKYCTALSFRYNVICEFSANEQEFFYNDLALAIKKNKSVNENDFKKSYPSDEVFLSHFRFKHFPYTNPSMKIVRYILGGIEKLLIENRKPYPTLNSNNTIEHILPQSPNKDWKISEDDHRKLVNRLGNLTLLSKPEQKKTLNYSFKIKSGIYKSSEYKISNEIITSSKNGWDKEMIDQRQVWLGNKAKTIWSIPNI